MVTEQKSYIVDPGDRFKKSIDKSIAKVTDLTIPFKLMTQSWFKSNVAIFTLKGPGQFAPLGGRDPDGIPEGSSISNRKRAERRKKAKYGFDYPLLVATGSLARSMTQPNDSGSVAEIINKRILILGTKVVSKTGKRAGYPYPIALQRSSEKCPYLPRPFVMIGGEQAGLPVINKRRELWINMLNAHIAKSLKA